MSSRQTISLAAVASISTLVLMVVVPAEWPFRAILVLGVAMATTILVLQLLRRLDRSASHDEPSVLLANVSHEIRTPLNGILGLTQLMLKMQATPQQREYLESIKSSGESLLRLINDLLDYSRLRSGKLRFDHEEFGLRKSVRDTVKALAPQAHLKELEIAFWVKPDVPDALRGDSSRLRQVLTNLLVNAIKFTDSGEVFLEVSLERSEDGAAHLRFAVSDTGIGVPEKERRAIFESFKQAEGTGLEQSGVGLGLAISSDLVERMGGAFELSSDEGQGSTFSFTARFEMDGSEGEPYEPGPSEPMDGLKVLVVDDSPAVRKVLARQLTAWGFEVFTASDAYAALEAVRAKPELSLLMLDSRLPDVDSWTLAEQLQASRPIPGILMTFSHEHVDTESLRAHGFLGHLSKPIVPTHLLRAIEIIRRGATVDTPDDVQTKSMDRLAIGGLRVLLAEDNPVNRTVVVQMLEKLGCEVVAVEDGHSALEMLDERAFDLGLLDVEMPGLDGVDVASTIREKEARTGNHLPLVAVTAHVNEEDRERCRRAGMDGFVSKPFQEDELVAVMRQSSRSSVQCGADALVFDKSAALARANGDPALLSELSGLFLEEAPQIFEAMAAALTAANHAGVERLAHRLKGSLLTLSARPAAELALALEMAARRGSLDDCEKALEGLRAELGRLEPELLSVADEVKSR